MKYYVRITRYTLEKDIISRFPQEFGIVIPANILLYYEKSLAKYINNINKSFFIDPMTYVFTNPRNMFKTNNGTYELDSRNNYKLKKSYEKLIKKYYKDLEGQFKSDIPLQPEYFSYSALVKSFINNTINYQKETLINKLEKVSRYESMIGEERLSESALTPEFLTLPYFYFDNLSDPWYDVNVLLSEEIKSIKKDKEIFSILCMNKALLTSPSVPRRIAKDFSNADGFLLFISGLDGEDDSVDLLRHFASFVQSLFRESAKPIINMYSSFFSNILKYFGLIGTSSGLCILDHRDAKVVYTTGRAFLSFYLPSIHANISEDNFKTYLKKYDPSIECDCLFCREISGLKRSLPKISFEENIDKRFAVFRGGLMSSAMKHFLYNRLKEVEEINSINLQETIDHLRTDASKARQYSTLLEINNYPERWLNVFVRRRRR